MPLSRLSDTGGVSIKLDNATTLSKLGDTGGAGLVSLGSKYSFSQKVGGFAVSTLESFPELFGIEPGETTQNYRAVNPIGGFLSQAAGAFVPYVGAGKLARLAPLSRDFILAAEGLGNTSLTRGALGAASEAAVVEAGRLGISATGAPKAIYDSATGRDAETRSLGLMGGEALMNVGGGAVLGGALGALSGRLSKGMKISDFTGMDPSEPITLQVRAIDDLLAKHNDPLQPKVSFGPEVVSRLMQERANLQRFNLLDVEPTFTDTGETLAGPLKQDLGKSYKKLIGDNKDQIYGYLNRINSGWKGSKPDKLTQVRRLYYSPTRVGTYHDEGELAQDLAAAGTDLDTLGTWAQDVKTIEVKTGNQGMPKKAEPVDGLPEKLGGEADRRLLSSEDEWEPKPKDALLGRARGLQKRFTSKVFADVGDGWRQAVDEDGFSVLAKKVRGGVDPGHGDRWLVLRTDAPDRFVTKSAAMGRELKKSGYYPTAEELDNIPEPLWQVGKLTLKQTENEVSNAVKQRKTKVGAMVRDVAETARTYVQPTVFLMQRQKLAAQGYALIKALEGAAEGRVTNLMLGEHNIAAGERAAGVLSLGKKAETGFQAQIDKMLPEDLADIQFVLEEELPIDKVRALAQRPDMSGNPIISEKALAYLEAMNHIDEGYAQRVATLGSSLKTDPALNALNQFKQRKGHYGITRSFPGSYKIYLKNAEGDVEGYATGKDWKDAEDQAKLIIDHWAKRNRILTEGGRVDEAIRTEEEIAAMKRRIARPGFIKARQGMLGYDLNRGALDSKKLSEMTALNLRARENFLRDIIADDMLAPLRGKLERVSPVDAKRLEDARRIMAGDEGAFAKAQNAVADKVLASVGLTGKDSATNIVRATQSILSQFQFNFGNLTQPITNMTGILQTLLPHVAFITHASPETLARTHASLPMIDGKGMLKGSFGALSEVKILMSAFKRVGVKFGDQPQDYQEFIELMKRQRVLHPRFVEADIGTDGAILRDPVAAFKGAGHFVDYLKAANSLLISKSEELSRLITLNAAYDIGKVMNLDPGQMAIFARDMVARVNYNYGAADRAKVFTTPIGAFAGTFKNWMFHYMSAMLGYASAGREGMPALMWQTAATGVLGGAVATPLVVPMADAASKFFTDKNFMQNLYDSTGAAGMDERVADGIMYGLPGTVGVSLASQISSPGSDPQRDAQMIFSFAAMSRVKALSAGVRDAFVVAQTTGESPWEDEKVRGEFVRALAPRTIYRAMALTSEMGVKSLATGYDVTKPMGLGAAAFYAAGFSPVELDKTYAVYNEVRNGQRKAKELVQEYGQTLAQAWETGDDRAASRVFLRAMATGVDSASVLRSAEARRKRAQETQLEFSASPEDQANYEFMFND